MKIGKGRIVEDRLLYQTVNFDNEITYFFQFCNIITRHKLTELYSIWC